MQRNLAGAQPHDTQRTQPLLLRFSELLLCWNKLSCAGMRAQEQRWEQGELGPRGWQGMAMHPAQPFGAGRGLQGLPATAPSTDWRGQASLRAFLGLSEM